jgi:hypothetical protein
MYDDIRRGDLGDSTYMMCGTIVSAFISPILLFTSLVVLVQPDGLQGWLLTWAQSEYRVVIAWINIACILAGWAIFFSYVAVVENRQADIKTYGIVANILYYVHHILTGGGVIMLPIVLLATIICFVRNIIDSSTMFVMKLPVYISSIKNRRVMLNADTQQNLAVTFDDVNKFLDDNA